MKTHLILSTVLLVFLSSCQNSEDKKSTAAGKLIQTESSIERGKYLVEIMDCTSCHSPKVFTPEGPIPDPTRLLGGV